MKLFLKLVVVGLATAIAFPATASSPKDGHDALQIRSYRFSYHPKKDFERLVLEFEGKRSRQSIHVKAFPNPSEKVTKITVPSLALVGAIPEAAINNSYLKKSRYFGNIFLSSENKGTAFNTHYKDDSITLESFWLDNPSRLVIDAFPAKALRAKNQEGVRKSEPEPTDESSTTVETAQNEKTKVSNEEDSLKPQHLIPRHLSATGKPTKRFTCYPANAAVSALVNRQAPKNGKETWVVETTGESLAAVKGSSSDDILCYPKKAQLKTKVLLYSQQETKVENSPSTVNPTESESHKAISKMTPGDSAGETTAVRASAMATETKPVNTSAVDPEPVHAKTVTHEPAPAKTVTHEPAPAKTISSPVETTTVKVTAPANESAPAKAFTPATEPTPVKSSAVATETTPAKTSAIATETTPAKTSAIATETTPVKPSATVVEPAPAKAVLTESLLVPAPKNETSTLKGIAPFLKERPAVSETPVSPSSIEKALPVPPLERVPSAMPPLLPPPTGMGELPPMPSPFEEPLVKSPPSVSPDKDKKTVQE